MKKYCVKDVRLKTDCNIIGYADTKQELAKLLRSNDKRWQRRGGLYQISANGALLDLGSHTTEEWILKLDLPAD